MELATHGTYTQKGVGIERRGDLWAHFSLDYCEL